MFLKAPTTTLRVSILNENENRTKMLFERAEKSGADFLFSVKACLMRAVNIDFVFMSCPLCFCKASKFYALLKSFVEFLKMFFYAENLNLLEEFLLKF